MAKAWLYLIALSALVVASLSTGCGEELNQPAYAVFRYVNESGQAIPVSGPQSVDAAARGTLVRQDRTSLPNGMDAIQQIWVIDPLEAPPAEYTFEMTTDGLIAISGGSFDDFVLTPPTF